MAELMIVVAVLAVLAGIAIPRFANLIEKSKEAEAKASLGSFRTAINLYYASTEGLHPGETEEGLVPVFLEHIPFIAIPGEAKHPLANGVRSSPDDWATGDAWVYDAARGRVNINCLHTDLNARVWSQL